MDTQSLEQLRQRILAAVEAYDAKFESDLNGYRKQRAWKIMLAFRKAYSLAMRDGPRGWARLLGWGLGPLIGRPLDLGTEELRFPAAVECLPEELFYPFAEGAARSPGLLRNQHPYDVVVFPVFEYDFRFQRPQQIAVEFARRGHRVFWMSPSRVVTGSRSKLYEALPLRENLWELRLQMPPQEPYRGALKQSDLEAMTKALAQARRDLGSVPTCAIVQFPYWRQLALALRESFGDTVLYDCMDDWRNWPGKSRVGDFALEEEQRLVGECDLLVASSKLLEDRYRAEGLSPILVRNAADFAWFSSGPSHGFLSDVPRPIIGYYGAIADWFDLPLLEEIARNRPQYSFVLIGETYRSDIARLRSLPNVRLLGERPYRELSSYLREFDVCLIPFTMGPLTAAVDPVKVYEYLSQAKPVVSARLPELKALEGCIYFAEGAEQFAAQIDAALGESDARVREERVSFAARNTWAERVREITETVRSRLPLVSILIVTYNCREFLRPCIESIFRNGEYPNFEIVLVDNHSTDGTEEVLTQFAAADPRIRVETLPENRGFAGGNNEAARLSRGDYLLLLNPDTIVTRGWIHRLMRLFRTNPSTGIAAPVTNFSGNETKIDFEYSDLATLDEFAASVAGLRRGEYTEIAVAPLFCALVSRALWLSLEGLDESFRVGTFEDDDFSLRVRQAGLKVLAAEDCFIHHFGGGSFNKLSTAESDRVFEENRKRFEEKWNRSWERHRLRPGVKSPQQERRFLPREFRTDRTASA